MASGVQFYLLVTFLIIVIVSPFISAQPPTADELIEKDRTARHLLFKSGKNVAGTQERGFFGTIFNVIVEQINDTKSAYSQISDLISSQFADENVSTPNTVIIRTNGGRTAVTPAPDPSNNGTTETPKLTRTAFLKILDRNLKGLSRLRALEWREAKKDSAANFRAYMDEIFRGKKATNNR